jgi:3-isopropylmalate/(R)-2-methylmalate dehydratase small subunit
LIQGRCDKTIEIKGKVFLFGDNVNTDDIVPHQYLTLRDDSELAQHTLENIKPNFAQNVKEGDIIVAGKNFGSGSSREEAVNVLKTLGIKAVIAESFARIYFRNLINLGILAIKISDVRHKFDEGDLIKISLEESKIVNETKGIEIEIDKIPTFLVEILEAGGILNQILNKVKK